jgi:hypothetical protein
LTFPSSPVIPSRFAGEEYPDEQFPSGGGFRPSQPSLTFPTHSKRRSKRFCYLFSPNIQTILLTFVYLCANMLHGFLAAHLVFTIYNP